MDSYPEEGQIVYALCGNIWRYGKAEYHKGKFLQIHDETIGHAWQGISDWVDAACVNARLDHAELIVE